LRDPRKDLFDDPRMLGNWLKSCLSVTLLHRNIAVSEGSTGHHVDRTSLGCVLLATPTPLHDLGALVLGDNALHLEQQVVFRALAEWPVQGNPFQRRAGAIRR
jgi:hypothetical protein